MASYAVIGFHAALIMLLDASFLVSRRLNFETMSIYTARDLIDLGFDPNDPDFKNDLAIAKSANCSRKELVDVIFEARRTAVEQPDQPRTYSFDEAVAYLRGWLGTESNLEALTYDEVCAMFKNAAACVECANDGIGNRPT